jgi:hypothetical protein
MWHGRACAPGPNGCPIAGAARQLTGEGQRLRDAPFRGAQGPGRAQGALVPLIVHMARHAARVEGSTPAPAAGGTPPSRRDGHILALPAPMALMSPPPRPRSPLPPPSSRAQLLVTMASRSVAAATAAALGAALLLLAAVLQTTPSGPAANAATRLTRRALLASGATPPSAAAVKDASTASAKAGPKPAGGGSNATSTTGPAGAATKASAAAAKAGAEGSAGATAGKKSVVGGPEDTPKLPGPKAAKEPGSTPLAGAAVAAVVPPVAAPALPPSLPPAPAPQPPPTAAAQKVAFVAFGQYGREILRARCACFHPPRVRHVEWCCLTLAFALLVWPRACERTRG